MLTNDIKFGKRALSKKMVIKTWYGCLDNENKLLPDWHKLKGVLVGIFSLHPPRCDWQGLAETG